MVGISKLCFYLKRVCVLVHLGPNVDHKYYFTKSLIQALILLKVLLYKKFFANLQICFKFIKVYFSYYFALKQTLIFFYLTYFNKPINIFDISKENFEEFQNEHFNIRQFPIFLFNNRDNKTYCMQSYKISTRGSPQRFHKFDV